MYPIDYQTMKTEHADRVAVAAAFRRAGEARRARSGQEPFDLVIAVRGIAGALRHALPGSTRRRATA